MGKDNVSALLRQNVHQHWHLHTHSVSIPGHSFCRHPGFLDFFIPNFPGMKTARFPGKLGTANSTVHVQFCNRQRPTHVGIDGCCSSVLVLHGEDEEYLCKHDTAAPTPVHL